MSPRAVVTVAVVFLLVLAGCSAFTGGSSAPADQETVTPVPLTTDDEPTATATPREDYPSGVFPNGTVDVDALVAAHEAQVANRSYTWEFRYAIANEGDDPFDGGFTRRVEVSPEALVVEQRSQGMSPNQTLYVDDSGYLRTVRGDRAMYEQLDDPGDHYTYAFTEDVIRRFLTGVDVDVTVVERGGQTYYRLYSTDFDVPRALDMFDAKVWNYSMTLYVTSEGFIQTMAVDYERESQSGDERISARFDYTAMDDTTVTEPDWVSNVTPTPTATPTTVTPATTETPSVTVTGTPSEDLTATPTVTTVPESTTTGGSNATTTPGSASTDEGTPA